MLDVRRLRLLRELAHRGTIAAVAESLSYTPSAVSQQLSALEREAGVALLERDGRSVRLTAAGELLVTHAEDLLARLARADADLAALATAVIGELRIGAFPSAVRPIATPALIALADAHPGLRVQIVEIDPAMAPDALRTGALDLALLHDYDCFAATSEPTLDTEPLLDETVYLAALGAVSLADAATLPWISGTPDTLCHAATLRICENAGYLPQIRHRVDDYAAVLALVAAGQGVALVPEIAAVPAPPAVTVNGLDVRRRTRIAMRRGTGHDPRVRAGCDALRRVSRSASRRPPRRPRSPA